MAGGSSQGILGPYLALFASAEIYIFVFIEIVTKTDTVQRVLFKTAQVRDYLVFIVLFGLFSIFGTYVGVNTDYDAISNIRDIGPIVAGLVAGPYAGIAVGLIGGIHRLFLGGISAVPCAVGTILAGILAGAVYYISKGKLPGIVVAIVFAAAVELLHGFLVLVMIQPYSFATAVFLATIPQMIIANSLGVGICIIVIHSRTELHQILLRE